MSVRSPLYVAVFVFGLALLILIISLGAIVAIGLRNRRPGFSCLAGGMGATACMQQQENKSGRRTQMSRIKRLLLYASSLSAIVFGLAAPSATAQELHGHNVCRSVGAFTPEQLGDREGHALSISQSSCQVTEGLLAGAVQDETNVLEWDGPKAKELSAYGVARKPGATYAFQHTDGTLEVTMADGKPSGWTASGHGFVTMATGSLASLNGKNFEWTGKGTGPNVFEADYTFK